MNNHEFARRFAAVTIFVWTLVCQICTLITCFLGLVSLIPAVGNGVVLFVPLLLGLILMIITSTIISGWTAEQVYGK